MRITGEPLRQQEKPISVQHDLCRSITIYRELPWEPTQVINLRLKYVHTFTQTPSFESRPVLSLAWNS